MNSNNNGGISYKECSYCHKMINASKHHECEVYKQQRNYQKMIYANKSKEITRPLQSVRWRQLRKRIILADGGRCQRCLLRYGINNYSNLEIHHIKPRIKNPELMFDEDNLVTLCHSCNAQLGLSGIDFDWSPKNREIDHDYRFL